MAPTFNPPPPQVDSHILLSFPSPHILLVSLNRPTSMNCISTSGNQQLYKIWSWYDSTPSLRCAIITGALRPNTRPSFCAGMDLKEWNTDASSNTKKSPMLGGFAGLSSRRGKKPIISAVHGICYGGGFEAVVNTDLIIAHADSMFSLPETSRGVVAIAGALPRIAMLLGLQRASELVLTGRVLTAQEAREWGFVNEVVEEGSVVNAALRWADKILRQSPDSVIVSRAGLRAAFGTDGVDAGMKRVEEGIWQELQAGENIREGLKAFVEKRDVQWVNSKL